MSKENKIFEIEVWFRYVSNGEQEKDYYFHAIDAVNVQEAVVKAKELYKSKTVIPFKFYHNKIQINT